jgi:cysteine desulfurase/selenocysteine lyase
MTAIAHKHGAVVLVDGAQAVPHFKVDVQDLDCDFYAFSGHKMFGPTGVGVLYGKHEYLEKMPPYKGGGEMILSVSFEKTIYNEIPHKFEAGTPAIMPVIGLGAAVDYIEKIGISNIELHGKALLDYATTKIQELPSVKIIGTARDKVAVLSFIIDGVHPHDIGTILNDAGVAVRTGHHCAEPVMRFFNLPGTTRASFSVYNTYAEVDQLILAINEVIKIFK